MSLLSIIAASCKGGSILTAETPDPVPVYRPVLIVINGESNSGGQVFNTNCTEDELAARPAVKILNNTTLQLESLDIGTNNLLGHTGLDSTRHGWENQLAHRVEAGTFGMAPVYLVKTGQGGAKVSELIDGGNYQGFNSWEAFTTRTTAAINGINAIHGQAPDIYVLYSQGINDQIASTPAATWKTQTLAHFENIRMHLGFVPIVMTKFNDPMTMTAYNNTIEQIAGEMQNVSAIDTTGATLDDVYHWDYAGMKTVGNRLLDAVKLYMPAS